jgi:hypothetical protein
VYYVASYRGAIKHKQSGSSSSDGKQYLVVFDGEEVERTVPYVVDINVNVRNVPTLIATTPCQTGHVLHPWVETTLERLRGEKKVREELASISESKIERKELHSRKRRRANEAPLTPQTAPQDIKRHPVDISFPVVKEVSFPENCANAPLLASEAQVDESSGPGYTSSLGAYHEWDQIKVLTSKNLTVASYIAPES